jgi:formylglycine-generating enzyme required for sulfatase activity
LSRQDGLQPAYDGLGGCDSNPESVTWDRSANGYRLATDVEWEIAASWDLGRRRRTTVSRWEMVPVAERVDGLSASELEAVAWYRQKSGGTPHSVCTRQPNALGLCDASGNVWEWTWDRRGDEPAWKADPAGAYPGSFRILRGGSWDSNLQGMTVTRRLKAGVSDRFDFVGLRLVRSSAPP